MKSIMSNTPKRAQAPKPAWATASERIKWLVETKFKGNRSALAKAIGFSHTIVGRVAAGATPGRRLLEAVVRHLYVNPVWLERGEGQPLPDGHADGERRLPVATAARPGPPLSHQHLLEGWLLVPEVVPSPSVYWLALQGDQPIVAQPSTGFRGGDLLLMETDPAKFPKESSLIGDVCVVRGGEGGSRLRLATLDRRGGGFDDEDPHIEADYHDAVKTPGMVVENVYRHFPNGQVQHFQTSRPPGRGAGPAAEPLIPTVRYTDIVAVWLRILRRRG